MPVVPTLAVGTDAVEQAAAPLLPVVQIRGAEGQKPSGDLSGPRWLERP
ncbi:MAG: hypothetical protein ACLP9L_09060 [Thermoguttaceae bacterium]